MRPKSMPLICLSVIALFMACKKTIGLPETLQNKILEYKVTNLQDTVIYGAIDDMEKSITVYIPFYYNLSVIDPEIKLSSGATLAEKTAPVEVDKQDVVYNVRGTDGSTATYELKVVLQNPGKLKIKEASTATNTAVYYPNDLITISGNFYASDASVVQSFLVAKKGNTEIPVNYGTVYSSHNLESDGTVNYSLAYQTLRPTIDSGLYYIKVKVFGQTATSQYPVRISYKQPDFLPLSRELRQGESFYYNVPQGNVLTSVKSVSIEDKNGTFIPITIESYTRTQLNLKIPDNFPVGNYSGYRIKLEFDTWNPVTKYLTTFIVSAKS
jgi:hypothetical protein